MKAIHVSDTAARSNGGSRNGESGVERALEVLAELRQLGQDDDATRSQLDANGSRYLELFDLAPGSYVETDMEGVIRLANLVTGDMLRVRQDKLAGKALVEFVTTESRPAFDALLQRLQRGEEATGWYTRVQPSSGRALDVFVAVKRGWDGGGSRVLRWLLHDITERNQLGKRNGHKAVSARVGYSR